MTSDYPIIQPPFTLQFDEMSKEELQQYFTWFMNAIPPRVQILQNEVTQSPNFASWRADRSPSSLDSLGHWFASQVTARSRTPEDMAELKLGGRQFSEAAPNQELTNRTFSIAFDVGLYLSEVFRANCPSLRWEQPLKTKKFVDYGQPVLVDFEFGCFNPVRLMVTLAYGFLDGSRKPARLRELFDLWSSKAKS